MLGSIYMKKINYSLAILSILVFGLVFTPLSEVLAYYDDCFGGSGWASGGGISFGDPNDFYQPTTPAPAPTVYSSNKAKRARNINQFRRSW